jgi:hypothetical protein
LQVLSSHFQRIGQAGELLQTNGLSKMSTWVGEGPMTFRAAALVGGVVMVIQVQAETIPRQSSG